jgi:hypothetical protein
MSDFMDSTSVMMVSFLHSDFCVISSLYSLSIVSILIVVCFMSFITLRLWGLVAQEAMNNGNNVMYFLYHDLKGFLHFQV